MHVTDRDLTLYVSAELTPSRMLWLENHCEVCESCAQAVCQEAQLELNLRAWAKEERCGRRAEAPSALVISEKVPTVHPEPPSAKLRTGFDKAQDRIRRGTLDDTSADPSTSLPRNSFTSSRPKHAKLLHSPFTPRAVEARRSFRPALSPLRQSSGQASLEMNGIVLGTSLFLCRNGWQTPVNDLRVNGAKVGSSVQVLQTLFLFGSMVFAMMLLMSSHLDLNETLSPLSPNQTWLSDAGGLATYLKPHLSTGEIGISGGTP